MNLSQHSIVPETGEPTHRISQPGSVLTPTCVDCVCIPEGTICPEHSYKVRDKQDG